MAFWRTQCEVFVIVITLTLVARACEADPVPHCLFINEWTPRVLADEFNGHAIWSTNWGHEEALFTPPHFAVFRSIDENTSDGFVWMHVAAADNVRELVAVSLLRCRSMLRAYHSGCIRRDRFAYEQYRPRRIVFFVHDENGFEERYAFAIEAEHLFDVSADMEATLARVLVVTPRQDFADIELHEWIYGDCDTVPLNECFPLDATRSKTLFVPSERGPYPDTELGAEIDWDPVAYSVEPWNIQWMTTGFTYYNYCEYRREPISGDLIGRFHYRADIREGAMLRDVVEFAYRQTRMVLQRQFIGGRLHPSIRSLRGTVEYPAPGRFLLRIDGTRFIVAIPADVLFASETTVEKALAASWVFEVVETENEDWVVDMTDPRCEVMPETVWDVSIEPSDALREVSGE